MLLAPLLAAAHVGATPSMHLGRLLSEGDCQPGDYNYPNCDQPHYYYYGGGGGLAAAAACACLCCRKKRRDGTYGGCCSRCTEGDEESPPLREPLHRQQPVPNSHRQQSGPPVVSSVPVITSVPIATSVAMGLPVYTTEAGASAGDAASTAVAPSSKQTAHRIAAETGRSVQECAAILRELHAAEQKAVRGPAVDYAMAAQYKARIERLEELAEKSAGLMAEEEAAARRSDYRLAGDLKDQSEEMRRTLQDLLAEPI